MRGAVLNAPGDVNRSLAVVLCLLTVFGPISMDLYLPVLPALTTELGAATSAAQLTVTACLLGLAIGQVVAGPLSDRFGRRRPLLVRVVACLVIFRETLPRQNRVSGGLTRTGHDFRRLLADRVLLGTALVTGLVSAALFAWPARAGCSSPSPCTCPWSR